jgi:hypothetical protein
LIVPKSPVLKVTEQTALFFLTIPSFENKIIREKIKPEERRTYEPESDRFVEQGPVEGVDGNLSVHVSTL